MLRQAGRVGDVREQPDGRSTFTPEAQDQVKRGCFLDVVLPRRAVVLQLLAGEDQALLVRRDAVPVLDLGLHVGDFLSPADHERGLFSRQSLDDDMQLLLLQRRGGEGNHAQRACSGRIVLVGDGRNHGTQCTEPVAVMSTVRVKER